METKDFITETSNEKAQLAQQDLPNEKIEKETEEFKEEAKTSENPEVTKKKRYRKKKVQDKLVICKPKTFNINKMSIVKKALEIRWKSTFIFDFSQFLTMKTRRK